MNLTGRLLFLKEGFVIPFCSASIHEQVTLYTLQLKSNSVKPKKTS